MDDDNTLARLAGCDIADAVAIGDGFEPAALRNHANAVKHGASTPERAHAFAAQLHTRLVALAKIMERS